MLRKKLFKNLKEKKKIMFLGASEAQIPPIKYAKKEGYYVISCDRKKDSPGFKIL